MRFKNDKQRKAVMASLRNQGFSHTSAKFIVDKNPKLMGLSPRLQEAIRKNPELAKLNFQELKKRGVFLKFQSDSDKDGVVNIKDCKPLDKRHQGLLHVLIKKKNELVKRRAVRLEQKQDALLNKIDSERTKLKKQLRVQQELKQNKKLKNELIALKKARFALTPAGRITAFAAPKIQKAARKGLKRLEKELGF